METLTPKMFVWCVNERKAKILLPCCANKKHLLRKQNALEKYRNSYFTSGYAASALRVHPGQTGKHRSQGTQQYFPVCRDLVTRKQSATHALPVQVNCPPSLQCWGFCWASVG